MIAIQRGAVFMSFKMTIPGEGHEDVGDKQENDRL